jgi:hypothetical protein
MDSEDLILYVFMKLTDRVKIKFGQLKKLQHVLLFSLNRLTNRKVKSFVY